LVKFRRDLVKSGADLVKSRRESVKSLANFRQHLRICWGFEEMRTAAFKPPLFRRAIPKNLQKLETGQSQTAFYGSRQ
jgi:hypothetical protein